jgi:5-methyltetrahydrofolate--homocysteine methyltransferase
MNSYETLTEAIRKGDKNLVESEVKKALSQGLDPNDILKGGLIRGMGIVGPLFRDGLMFIPEVLMSAQAMRRGIEVIKPLLNKSDQSSPGKFLIGTVAGDIHDIGKNIVGMLIESNGFEVIDLGVNVQNETFVQAVEEHKPDILGISALLTSTIPNMGIVIDLLKTRGIRNNVKIIVGGASVNQEFADIIEADGYAPDAGSASQWVKNAIFQNKGG